MTKAASASSFLQFPIHAQFSYYLPHSTFLNQTRTTEWESPPPFYSHVKAIPLTNLSLSRLAHLSLGSASLSASSHKSAPHTTFLNSHRECLHTQTLNSLYTLLCFFMAFYLSTWTFSQKNKLSRKTAQNKLSRKKSRLKLSISNTLLSYSNISPSLPIKIPLTNLSTLSDWRPNLKQPLRIKQTTRPHPLYPSRKLPL